MQPQTIIDEDKVDKAFKTGLDLQREQFKAAKYTNDYDSMADALENIKSEIREEMIKVQTPPPKGKKTPLAQICLILIWYRNLESKYTQNTPDGKQVVFPPNFHNKVNHNLTICYEILINQLRKLKLL